MLEEKLVKHERSKYDARLHVHSYLTAIILKKTANLFGNQNDDISLNKSLRWQFETLRIALNERYLICHYDNLYPNFECQ